MKYFVLAVSLTSVVSIFGCSSSSSTPGGGGGSGGASTGGGGASSTGGGGASSTGGSGGSAGAVGSFAISIPGFTAGSAFPAAITCDGNAFGTGTSPELDWTAGPAGTKSYAIVLEDQSLALAAPGHAFHWAVWDIPAATLKLPAGVAYVANGMEQMVSALGAGAQQYNAGPFASPYSYFGPCPDWMSFCDPSIPRTSDNYTFTIYALPNAVTTVPAPPAAGTMANYVQTLDQTFIAAAIGTAKLTATSNATPNSLAGTPIMCPTAAGGEGGEGGEPSGGTGGGTGGTGGASGGAGGSAGHGGNGGNGGTGGH